MREELDKIVNSYNLIDRTYDGFWKCYESYLASEPEESSKMEFNNRKSVEPKLYGYAFCVTNELDFDCVKVYIDIFKVGNTMRCGDYWCIYDLEGNLYDDFFDIT